MRTSPRLDRPTRRDWLAQLARHDTVARGRQSTAGRSLESPLVPRTDLVNVLEYEAQAARVVRPETMAELTGSDRAATDRVTLRPRVMVPTRDLDLSLSLFGTTHVAPVLVAPVAAQRRFHAEGEVATARGSGAAQSTLVVAQRSDRSLSDIMAATPFTPWFQVFASDQHAVRDARAALSAGCRVVVATVGATGEADGTMRRTPLSWDAVRRLADTVAEPVVVKGIRTAAGAQAAIAAGARGIIVSHHALPRGRARSLLLDVAGIVDAARGRVPVLIDGDFRRGTDVLKALALGATAVLVARPVMWGLSAYGADGVQGVLEMLQTELARYVAMSGRTRLSQLDRSLVTVHAR